MWNRSEILHLHRVKNLEKKEICNDSDRSVEL